MVLRWVPPGLHHLRRIHNPHRHPGLFLIHIQARHSPWARRCPQTWCHLLWFPLVGAPPGLRESANIYIFEKEFKELLQDCNKQDKEKSSEDCC